MESLTDQVRRIVREQRPEGLTDYRLARLLGVHQSTLSRFLAGGGITPEHLDRLAELFALSVKSDRAAMRRNLADTSEREAA